MQQLIYTFMVIEHHEKTLEESRRVFFTLARFQSNQTAFPWAAVEIAYRKLQSEKYILFVTFLRYLPYAFLR